MRPTVTDTPYADEPPITAQIASTIADFWNEPFAHINLVQEAIMAAGYEYSVNMSVVDTDTFRAAMDTARLAHHVRTIAERFADPDSRQALLGEGSKPFWAWVAASPKRIARIDELAGILNATDDPTAFKKAVNEIETLVYATPRKPTFQIPEAPTAALRTTLGDALAQDATIVRNPSISSLRA